MAIWDIKGASVGLFPYDTGRAVQYGIYWHTGAFDPPMYYATIYYKQQQALMNIDFWLREQELRTQLGFELGTDLSEQIYQNKFI